LNTAGLYKAIFDLHARAARTVFKDGRAFPPLQIFFELTSSCNLSCRFCFYKGSLNEKRRTLKKNLTTDEIMDIIHAMPGSRLISFSGGEPLLRKDILELLARASKIRTLSLETNGVALGANLAREMVDLGARNLLSPGLLSIDISVHGNRQTHDNITGKNGSWDKTRAAVLRLIAARRALGKRFPFVNIKTVLCEENSGQILDIYKTAHKLGIDHLVFKLLDPGRTGFENSGEKGPFLGIDEMPKWRETSLQKLDKQMKEAIRRARTDNMGIFFIPLSSTFEQVSRYYRSGWTPRDLTCSGIFSRLSVMPGGDYYLCKIFGYGNARQMKPMAAWNSIPFRSFRKKIIDYGPMDECMGCCYLEP